MIRKDGEFPSSRLLDEKEMRASQSQNMQPKKKHRKSGTPNKLRDQQKQQQQQPPPQASAAHCDWETGIISPSKLDEKPQASAQQSASSYRKGGLGIITCNSLTPWALEVVVVGKCVL